jgi:hypothetical protein
MRFKSYNHFLQSLLEPKGFVKTKSNLWHLEFDNGVISVKSQASSSLRALFINYSIAYYAIEYREKPKPEECDAHGRQPACMTREEIKEFNWATDDRGLLCFDEDRQAVIAKYVERHLNEIISWKEPKNLEWASHKYSPFEPIVHWPKVRKLM